MSSVKSTTLACYSPNLKKNQVPKPITELIKLSASSVIGWGIFKISKKHPRDHFSDFEINLKNIPVLGKKLPRARAL